MAMTLLIIPRKHTKARSIVTLSVAADATIAAARFFPLPEGESENELMKFTMPAGAP
jgi:hypothetical protein